MGFCIMPEDEILAEAVFDRKEAEQNRCFIPAGGSELVADEQVFKTNGTAYPIYVLAFYLHNVYQKLVLQRPGVLIVAYSRTTTSPDSFKAVLNLLMSGNITGAEDKARDAIEYCGCRQTRTCACNCHSMN